MRGIEVAEFGGLDAQIFRDDLPRPTVGADQVLVRNHFAGVNFKDLILCRGEYHGGNPDLPFIPGIESAGVVVEVGPEVDDFKVGQRVAYMTGSMASQHNACYAEYNVVSALGCIQVLPDDVSFEVGCALVIQGLTMHYLTSDCFTPNAGDAVLVHGGWGWFGPAHDRASQGVGCAGFDHGEPGRQTKSGQSSGCRPCHPLHGL